jgi:hypothetical protein
MASLAEREVHARRLAERHEWADSWRTRASEEMLSIAQSELADRFHQCTPAVAPLLAPPM